MQNLIIRQMQISEIGELCQLAETIWYQHYPAIISHQQIEYMLAQWYAPKLIEQQINEGICYLIATLNDTIIGYFSAERKPTLHFIHKFYVDPDYKRQGIGRALLDFWLAQTPEAKKLQLRTHRNNVHSIAFYHRLGFEIVASDNKHVGGGYMIDDYILERIIHCDF